MTLVYIWFIGLTLFVGFLYHVLRGHAQHGLNLFRPSRGERAKAHLDWIDPANRSPDG